MRQPRGRQWFRDRPLRRREKWVWVESDVIRRGVHCGKDFDDDDEEDMQLVAGWGWTSVESWRADIRLFRYRRKFQISIVYRT